MDGSQSQSGASEFSQLQEQLSSLEQSVLDALGEAPSIATVAPVQAPPTQPSAQARSWQETETGRQALARAEIPDKTYFRIGEVAKLVGVKPYVLRYWESEFSVLRPQKSQSQQRLYRRTDVERVFLVKFLLYSERYSIEGARRRIKELKNEPAAPAVLNQPISAIDKGSEQEALAQIEREHVLVSQSVLTPTLQDRERLKNLAREILFLLHGFEEQVLGDSSTF